jgi:hypothetical protein
MSLLKRRPFAVGYNIPHLVIDTFLNLFVFDARDFDTEVAFNANFAAIDFITLLNFDVCAVAGEVFVPSVAVFIGRLKKLERF